MKEIQIKTEKKNNDSSHQTDTTVTVHPYPAKEKLSS